LVVSFISAVSVDFSAVVRARRRGACWGGVTEAR
jgi:hypothetical protein